MNIKHLFCFHKYQNREAVMAKSVRWYGLYVKETCIKCSKEKYFHTTENTEQLVKEFSRDKCFISNTGELE